MAQKALALRRDARPERLHDAFSGETLTRLRRLKAQYDAENPFNENVTIFGQSQAVLRNFSSAVAIK